MEVPFCKVCEGYHHPWESHEINEVEDVVEKEAVSGEVGEVEGSKEVPSSEVGSGVRGGGEDAGRESKSGERAKKGRRGSREKYNAYMREYMKRRREKLKNGS